MEVNNQNIKNYKIMSENVDGLISPWCQSSTLIQDVVTHLGLLDNCDCGCWVPIKISSYHTFLPSGHSGRSYYFYNCVIWPFWFDQLLIHENWEWSDVNTWELVWLSRRKSWISASIRWIESRGRGSKETLNFFL